ncbi:624210e6-67c0-4aa9-a834-c00eb6265fbf [Sclerotinia trifoliorum]|uniref:624210e6-67c0-4aa9-a834-c00eb6265fbf n=1 Tax=Sclerotinia trifoliorum TaxID=28548 RepID=A0A8H2VTC5_9HELO|nr:624210e6-67c0-4aa9-a834-c00eb6265fbf [Sclerotinia trifoliorum]
MSSLLFSGLRSKPLATGLPPRHKIIVAIDYGTTYSGVSYGPSNTQNSDIVMYKPWLSPYQQEIRKVPTRIAYEMENATIPTCRWGFEVEPKHISCSWTKLLLDKNAVMDEENDITSVGSIDEGMMHLPPHRNANQVCEDFLRKMYDAFAAHAKETLGVDTFKMTPLDCWVTLPAIWSDEAKEATLNAAKEAGFAKNPLDEIHTIAEPEAAGISTLKELAAPGTLNAVQSGDNIMICDCGGGTVDITTYTITSVVPKLKFKELCIGTGGKCGSTYIDRQLHAMLSERFGDAFKAVSYSRKGPGSKFMNAWELLKKGFGNDMENPRMLDLSPLYLNFPSSHLYDNDEHAIYLSQ